MTTTVLLDAFDGTNGAAWSSANWTLSLGTGTATIQGNEGRLRSPTTPYTGAAAVAKMALVRDVELLTDIRFSGGEQYPAIGLRADGTVRDNGYPVGLGLQFFPGANGFGVSYSEASFTTAISGDQAFAFSSSITYRLRFRAVGDFVGVKLWNKTTTEPSAWTWSSTTGGSTSLNAGKVVVVSGGGGTGANDIFLNDMTATAAAPVIVGTATGRNSDGLNIVNLAVPAGAQAGDKLIAVFNTASTTSTLWSVTPSGWTVFRSRTSLGTRSAYIVARDWDGVTTSYAFNQTVNALTSAVMLLVRGADSISTWTKGTDWYRGTGTSSVQVIAGNVYSDAANSLAIGFALEATTATETEAQVTVSGGTKSIWYAGPDGTVTESVFVAYKEVSGVGTGSQNITVTYPNTQTNNGYGLQLMLPAAVPAAPSNITVVGTSSVGSASVNASTNPAVVSITAPAALAVGDYYVIAAVFAQGIATGGNAVTPDGFTLLHTTYTVADYRLMSVFGRQITNSTVLAAVQTVGLRAAPSATRIAGVGLALRGVDATNPLASLGGGGVFTSTATSLAPASLPATGSIRLYFTYTNNSASTVIPAHAPVGGGTNLVTATALDGGSGIPANSVLSAIRDLGSSVQFTSPGATNGGMLSLGLRAAATGTQPGVDAVYWDGALHHFGKITLLTTAGAEVVPASVSHGFALNTVSSLLADSPFYVAHRGGSTNWPEMSLRGYRNSALLGMKALEVSVFKTTDNVFVASHDASMLRTTGVDLDIRTSTWAQVNALSLWANTTDNTSQPAQPVANLDQIVAAFGSTHVIFLDDKATTNTPALLDYMDAHGGPTRWVWKEYRGGSRYLATRARGYTNWGFFYEADGESVFAAEIPKYDILGMEWNASQATWDRFTGTGKRVIGHIPDTLAKVNTALAKGATGIMLAAPRQGFPIG